MNNPMQMLGMINSLRNGGNPMQMLQQIAGNDPRAAQAMQMIKGKSNEELKQIAMNMCRERGVNPSDVAKSIGLY